jgi:hypothetical protein
MQRISDAVQVENQNPPDLRYRQLLIRGTRSSRADSKPCRGGWGRYDDPSRHPLFRLGGGPTAPDVMPHVVSAERHCELQHLAITRCVKDRGSRGRGCTAEVLVLSRQEIATDLRAPSGTAEQAHIPVSGVRMQHRVERPLSQDHPTIEPLGEALPHDARVWIPTVDLPKGRRQLGTASHHHGGTTTPRSGAPEGSRP